MRSVINRHGGHGWHWPSCLVGILPLVNQDVSECLGEVQQALRNFCGSEDTMTYITGEKSLDCDLRQCEMRGIWKESWRMKANVFCLFNMSPSVTVQDLNSTGELVFRFRVAQLMQRNAVEYLLYLAQEIFLTRDRTELRRQSINMLTDRLGLQRDEQSIWKQRFTTQVAYPRDMSAACARWRDWIVCRSRRPLRILATVLEQLESLSRNAVLLSLFISRRRELTMIIFVPDLRQFDDGCIMSNLSRGIPLKSWEAAVSMLADMPVPWRDDISVTEIMEVLSSRLTPFEHYQWHHGFAGIKSSRGTPNQWTATFVEAILKNANVTSRSGGTVAVSCDWFNGLWTLWQYSVVSGLPSPMSGKGWTFLSSTHEFTLYIKARVYESIGGLDSVLEAIIKRFAAKGDWVQAAINLLSPNAKTDPAIKAYFHLPYSFPKLNTPQTEETDRGVMQTWQTEYPICCLVILARLPLCYINQIIWDPREDVYSIVFRGALPTQAHQNPVITTDEVRNALCLFFNVKFQLPDIDIKSLIQDLGGAPDQLKGVSETVISA